MLLLKSKLYITDIFNLLKNNLEYTMESAIKENNEKIVLSLIEGNEYKDWNKAMNIALLENRFRLARLFANKGAKSNGELADFGPMAAENGMVELVEKYSNTIRDKIYSIMGASMGGHADIIDKLSQEINNNRYFTIKNNLGIFGASVSCQLSILNYFMSFEPEDMYDSCLRGSCCGKLSLVRYAINKGAVITEEIIKLSEEEECVKIVEYLRKKLKK